ncbi:cobyrinate a,c-diamide synthase [Yinghuangia soli]|uniref:Hydrogenobyrinate a,c-diamide synthase n=1 Tax=Yinghuangia soli TaxID=2908204 RepID=A0AA41PXE0_9ACTN|nr:cobyrinate a,c-diamide synthase [Yinghuangia soli]MCF2527493.1 cobyrinate a,c-diamide synthase [Yinghuangia soli]
MVTLRIPRLVVAAPASGQGKTTVATGLMAALAARGLAVSPHKVGPDYIDPGYHALACGRPGRNLDPFLVGEERIAPLFAHGARGADVAVVEGVMGLFDGAAGRGGFASTAHVARLLGAPVVLVVDARSQGRSVAALVHGFATFQPGLRPAGIILNRVGTERHEAILREALEPLGIPVLGVIGRHDAIAKPSRHLGLVPVAERHADAVATVDALGELVGRAVDLDAVLAIARGAGPLDAVPWDPADEIRMARGNAAAGPPAGQVGASAAALSGAPRNAQSREAGGAAAASSGASPGGDRRAADGARPRIALAGGAAFTFGYAETTELLAAAGAEVVTVDPLRDEDLPEGTSGLVLGGGFPEVYAAELSANSALRAAVADFAARGGAVAAECAGLLYLARSLDGSPMCGVLDAEARMTERLTLGYREATAAADSVLSTTGTPVRGHEFHRTAVTPRAGRTAAWNWPGAAPGEARSEPPGAETCDSFGRTVPAPDPGAARHTEGFIAGRVHASYLHTHWAGNPGAARRFAAHCGLR